MATRKKCYHCMMLNFTIRKDGKKITVTVARAKDSLNGHGRVSLEYKSGLKCIIKGFRTGSKRTRTVTLNGPFHSPMEEFKKMMLWVTQASSMSIGQYRSPSIDQQLKKAISELQTVEIEEKPYQPRKRGEQATTKKE